MKKFIRSSYMSIVLILVYIPIFILIIFSFNSSNSMLHFSGLSMRWYIAFFQNKSFLLSITLSLIVGISSTFVSVIIGTMAALGLSKTKKITRNITLGITNIPLINADVVTAVSLMLLFLSLSMPFGIFTLILAHISFDIPYVIIIMLPRLKKIDYKIIEASTDLGATPIYTLFKIILPMLKPAIITSVFIAFTMSFDDFIISYFNGGGANNVATYIYSLKIVEPYVNAFATMMISIIAFFFLFLNIIKLVVKNQKKKNIEIIKDIYKDEYILFWEWKLNDLYHKHNFLFLNKIKLNKKIIKKIKLYENKIYKEKTYILKIKNKMEKKSHREKAKYLKTFASNNKFYFVFKLIWKQTILVVITLGSFLLLISAYIVGSRYDLNIAIWGEYLPDSFLRDFEKESGLRVKVNEFDSNEGLYNKLQTYSKYDLMVPSAYMAVKLAQHNYLQKIDYSKITLNQNHEIAETKNDFWNNQVDPILNEVIVNSKTHANSNYDPRDYQIPYYWGDISIEIKPTSENLQFLYNNDTHLQSSIKVSNNIYTILNMTSFVQNFSWNDFISAANYGKKIVINDDPKNVFLPQTEVLENYVEPTTNASIDDVYNNTKNWMSKSNVSLQGDEILNTLASNNFDFALSYNGDALSALEQEPKQLNKFIVVYPHFNNEGTDIWEDGLVLNNKSTHVNNAYSFIQYFLNNQVSLHKDNDLFYTSPMKKDEEQIANQMDDMEKAAYLPLYFTGNKLNLGDSLFWNNLTDPYLVDQYSKIIASKSS